jgi:hypothetical protein
VQLDHDIKYTIPSGAGLDLSFLTAALVPPAMVEEDDTAWDFDSLLQQVFFFSSSIAVSSSAILFHVQVTQEFNAASERKAAAEKEQADADAKAAKRLGVDLSEEGGLSAGDSFDRLMEGKSGFGLKSGSQPQQRLGGRKRAESS